MPKKAISQSDRKTPVSFSLTEKTKRNIKRLAKAQGLSASALIETDYHAKKKP